MPRAILLALSVFLTLPFANLVEGQGLTGSITGMVLDAAGQAIPAAKVQVVNGSTNLTVNGQTDKSGSYQVANLPIGGYSVTFTSNGFQKEAHNNILVQANRTSTVNGALQIGQVSTTVEVSGTPLLNQVDTAVGYVLDQRTIENSPPATGSFTQLAILSPGINADFANGSGVNAGLGNEAIWANGQRDTSNSISINGANTNNLFNGKTGSQVSSSRFTLNTGQQNVGSGDTRTNTSVYDAIGNSIPSPPQETIAEMRVNTSQYDASNGPNSGAHVEVITRSGSNEMHGQLWEYFQNNIWNAAPFFRNANTSLPASQKVPALHYNRFGATVGGPAVKNKLFYFASYQGIRITDGLGGTSNVTVPLGLTDDRSAAALSQLASTTFKTSVPVSQISPAALKILQYKTKYGYLVPTPTITDPATAVRLGYDATLQQPASTFQADQGIGNLDYNLSDKDRLAVRYMFQDDPSTSPFAQSSLLGFPQTLNSGGNLATISNTVVLRPNLTWDQKIAFTRQRSYSNTSQPLTPSDAGINLFGITQFPSIFVSNVDPTLGKSISFGPNSNFANAGIFQNKYEAGTTVNWVAGKHTIYAGFNWDHTQLNIINRNNQTAALSFNSFPDFLTGTNLNTANSRFFNGSSNRYYRADQVGSFVQDNYRLRGNLNLSVGLRYDFDGPLSEKYGLLTNFYPELYQYDAVNDRVVNGGVVVAGNNTTLGTKGVSDSTLKGRQWGLGPRFGMVWSPAALKNVVIRAGFGLYYDRGEFFTELSPGAGRGFSGPFGVTLQQPFTAQINATGASTLDQPFGSTSPPAPSNAAAITQLLPNAAQLRTGAAPYLFSAYDPNNVLPYTENWSYDIQWQPLDSWVATVGYVGNRGLHALLPVPFNQPGIATSANPIHGEQYSYGFNVLPSQTLRTNEGGNTDLRVPFIGYSSNALYYQSRGNSTYHALQASLQKRFSHGLQFSASYTYSHSLDDQSGLGLFFNGNDPTNPASSYGTSTYDRTHVFTVSYQYELPKIANANKVVQAMASGWGVSGVTVAQSGQPFNFYDFSGAVGGIYYGNTLSVVDPILGFQPGLTYPQVTLQGQTGVNAKNPVIDTSKVAVPALPITASGISPCENVGGQQVCDTFETGFSNAGRNVFRGPFQTRFDFSASKEFRISERFRLKYRADVFNAFNHADFDVPSNSTSLYSVTAGKAPTVKPVTALGSLGFITSTLGSPRLIQMSLHLMF
ncbi:MAG: Oar protein [Bryobacterales bacterium]|nr:Oar protein [Bryobacterales bacterium]